MGNDHLVGHFSNPRIQPLNRPDPPSVAILPSLGIDGIAVPKYIKVA
jgi:hypothetical protein